MFFIWGHPVQPGTAISSCILSSILLSSSLHLQQNKIHPTQLNLKATRCLALLISSQKKHTLLDCLMVPNCSFKTIPDICLTDKIYWKEWVSGFCSTTLHFNIPSVVIPVRMSLCCQVRALPESERKRRIMPWPATGIESCSDFHQGICGKSLIDVGKAGGFRNSICR